MSYKDTYYYQKLNELDKEQIVKRLIAIYEAKWDAYNKLAKKFGVDADITIDSFNEAELLDEVIIALYDDEFYGRWANENH